MSSIEGKVRSLVKSDDDMKSAIEAVLNSANDDVVTWTDVRNDITTGQWGRMIEKGILVDADNGFSIESPTAIREEVSGSTASDTKAHSPTDIERKVHSLVNSYDEMEAAIQAVLDSASNDVVAWADVRDEITSAQWGLMIEKDILVDADGGFRIESPTAIRKKVSVSATSDTEAHSSSNNTSDTVDKGSKSSKTAFESIKDEYDNKDTEWVDTSKPSKKETIATSADSSESPPKTIPAGPTVSFDYSQIQKKQQMGRGGNADVIKASVPGLDSDQAIAIKRPHINGTLDRKRIKEILTEAKIWSKLDDHDHIVDVIDWGSNPVPWIAMEYMDCGHLGKVYQDMGLSQKLWTAIVVTKAVRHAHRRGVAHLDLKPENILFRTNLSGWDIPKVADWGLSKHLLEQSQSAEGLSPQYAAPEQFTDDYGATDDITDIYQLGAVLYKLFTGRPPFEGHPSEMRHKVMKETPQPPSEVANVPDSIDDIVMTALSKQRENRYEDIVYLRDDLVDLS